MRILLRHTLRSVKDNLGQLIVILITVTVVSALFFVAVTIGGLFTNLQTSLKSRLGGDTDVTVEDGTFSSARLLEFTEARSDEVEYVETFVQIPSLFRPADGAESKVVLAEATDLRDFAARHKNMPIFSSYEVSYGYPEVWVGRAFAEENNLSAGDTVSLYLETDKAYRYLTVTYIFENFGIFTNNVVNNILIDYSAVGNKGLINIANIKLGETADKEAFKSDLQTWLGTGVTVTDSVDIGEISEIVSSNQRLMNIVLVFVTALMIFILFTSFLVISKKRISELTLFRAAGASNGQLAAVLISEGLIYGLVGAVLGTALGRIGMGIAANAVIPNFPDAVHYSAIDYLLSVVFGVAVSGLSAIAPILRAGRESVRKATSDVAKAVKKRSPIPIIISSVTVATFALLTAFCQSAGIVFTVLLVLSSAFLIFFAARYVLTFVSYILRRFAPMRLGSMGIKRNPLAHTLSAMTGFVIVFTFATVSIVNIVIGAITPENDRFSADYVVEKAGGGELIELRKELADIYGVTSANIYLHDTFVYTSGSRTKEYEIFGADDATAVRALGKSIDEEALKAFDTELNPIIISYDLAERFGWKVGDKLYPVLAESGEKLYDEFTVVGIDYTETANDRKAFIRNSSFRINGRDYTPEEQIVFVSTDKDVPNSDLYKQLRTKCEDNYCYVLSFSDWAHATSVGIKGVATLLRILQILVSLVALVGVVNLTIVTLMERKREFNIFRASGMDSKSYLLLAITESLAIALSGATLGIVLSMTVNLLMPAFAKVIDRFFGLTVFPAAIAVISGICILAYTLIYVLSAVFRRKKDAIERNTY